MKSIDDVYFCVLVEGVVGRFMIFNALAHCFFEGFQYEEVKLYGLVLSMPLNSIFKDF